MIDSLICLLTLFPVDSLGVIQTDKYVLIEVRTVEGISSGWFNIECIKKKDDNK